jgi:hypothetical protein
MDLFVNELSLHGQFSSIGSFVGALKEIMGCRIVADGYRHPFWCLRTLASRDVLPGVSLREAVRQTRDVNLSRVVMTWLDRYGPFWDDGRAHSPDDYFEHAGEIVTDCGLGEAAFRLAAEQPSGMVGFSDSLFCTTPLNVVWRRSDSVSQGLDLPNFWNRIPLEEYLREHELAPQSWADLVERARSRYRNLTFVDSILEPLNGEPFNTTIADRVLKLLGILDHLKSSFEDDGRLSAEGHQLLQDYFHGDRALFTDESETNKRTFARQLTFRTPTGEELFCPYHGKISFRFYRVHHSWPIRSDQPLYIAYIGPKITKG